MKIIVTGGSGFIGYHLIEALVAGGNDVLSVDRVPPPVRHKEMVYLKMEAQCARAVDLLREWKPDAIVNLAAQTGVAGYVRYSAVDFYLDDNVKVLASVADVAAETGARLVHASSGALYSLSETRDGTMPPWASTYAISKLACEQFLRLYQLQRGLDWCALRFSNVYGPQWSPKAVVSAFVSSALRGEKMQIHGTGIQGRDFLYVDDVVSAITRAIGSDPARGRVMDLGTGTITSVRDLAVAVYTELDKRGVAFPEGEWIDFDTDTGEGAPTSWQELSDARDILKWGDTVDLALGLEVTMDEYVRRALAGEEPSKEYRRAVGRGKFPIDVSGLRGDE